MNYRAVLNVRKEIPFRYLGKTASLLILESPARYGKKYKRIRRVVVQVNSRWGSLNPYNFNNPNEEHAPGAIPASTSYTRVRVNGEKRMRNVWMPDVQELEKINYHGRLKDLRNVPGVVFPKKEEGLLEKLAGLIKPLFS
jgi:hypothetical protein